MKDVRNRPARGLITVLSVLLGAGAWVLLSHFPPAEYAWYPRCQFHTLTGLHCPGCGGLRALHALARGDLGSALSANLVVTLAVPIAVWVFLAQVWRCGRVGTLDLSTISPRWLWGAAIGIGIFTVLRNLPVAPFSWLAP